MLSDDRALFNAGSHRHRVVCACCIGAEDLLAEVSAAGRAHFLRCYGVALKPLLELVLAPDCLFVKLDLAVQCLCMDVTDLLHLQALFEALEFLEVFLFEHLADEEPVQVVLLERHVWRLLLLRIHHRFNLALLTMRVRFDNLVA